MKKIFVTGCNGQLGKAVNVYFDGNSDVELINTDVAELDISNIEEVTKMIEEIKPYAIINCAAYTAVDACETDWDNAFKINAIGPRNLAIAASKVGAKLVHVSTDYVFAGDAKEPYREYDIPNPVSAYGKTKLEGEKFVKEFCKEHFIVRTAWLYGDGKNFVKTMLRLAENNDEVNVVCDQVGSPTSTAVLADIIANLVFTENYGTFHGTCEGVCSWAEFTEEIFRLAGKQTKVNHITSEEYTGMFPNAAKRPAYSVLEKYMLRVTSGYVAKDWKDAIAEYMNSGIC